MNRPIATLSMYDWPETASALDRLWQLFNHELARHAIESPKILSRDKPVFDLWMKPELLVGQTCGWPYISHLRGRVIPFARFAYDLPECDPKCDTGYYNSVFIGRSKLDTKYLNDGKALLQAAKIAINGDDSQSGFHVFREITGEASPDAIPKQKRLITGTHRMSVRAVAEGHADIAAIDAIAFALACRYDPETTGKVHVIGHSKPAPGLPLVTSIENSTHVPALFAAVTSTVANLAKADRECLMIKGVVTAEDNEYDVFMN